MRHAPGVRPQQRLFPSIFEVFGHNVPVDPEGFDDEAELRRAADLARDADVAVVVVGEWQNQVGEQASRSSLELPARQLELVQAVAATGTPVVLLVMNGRPVDLRWPAEHVPAILDVWYPGTQGGAAVARLLFGDVSPGGKLPFTWPRTVGQVPMIYGHTRSHEPQNQGKRYWDDVSVPLYPFGHGLSYSRFEHADLTLDRDEIAADGSLTVSATVTNAGRARGRRGGAALRAPAARDRGPTGPRAQGVRARHARGRVSPGRSRSRWARSTCATGTPRRGTGWSTPRRTTSGSAATRPPSSARPSG